MHSLLLGIDATGFREPRPLPELAAWFGCFDVVQLNDAELAVLGTDPLELAAVALAAGVKLLVVTLGAEGAAYFAAAPFRLTGDSASGHGPIKTAKIAAEKIFDGDPTGCGDVFGATLFAELLRSVDLETSIVAANRVAGRNMQGRGATNLHYHLRGEIAPR